jgi:hypothetical protein
LYLNKYSTKLEPMKPAPPVIRKEYPAKSIS